MLVGLMVNITVTIPGKPFPCPRPRWGQGRTYIPAAYEDWLNGARMLIRNAAVTQNGGRLIHGPLRVQLTFIGAHGSSDIDNLAKSDLDGVVSVALFGLALHHRARPRLNDRHFYPATVVREDTRHSNFFTE